MSEHAAGLGGVICRKAVEFGLSGAHCYDRAVVERLGFAATVVLFILVGVAARRFGRWA